MAEKEILYYPTITPEGKIPERTGKEIAKKVREMFSGEQVVLSIKKKRKTRSTQQNRYYWGVIVKSFQQGAEEQWGEYLDSEECHENLKKECNWKEVVNTISGDIQKITESTAGLKTIEFEEYEERCRRLIFTYFGITVMLPNEQGEIEL